MLEDVLAQVRAEALQLERFGDAPARAARLREIADAVEAAVGPSYLRWLSESRIARDSGVSESWWAVRYPQLALRRLARRTPAMSREYRACLLGAVDERKAPLALIQWPRVYVIRNTGTRAVKIGISMDPHARLLALQTACAEPLVLEADIAGGLNTERELHNRFASSRLVGEWFASTPEIEEWIASLAPRVSA